MVWPFGGRQRRIERALREYRVAAAELRAASRESRLFGRRTRALGRAARRFERASDRLRDLGHFEPSGTYPRNWTTLRHLVFTRDRYRCTACGRKGRRVELHAHHRRPLARGGTNTLDNLTTLCRECHQLAHAARR